MRLFGVVVALVAIVEVMFLLNWCANNHDSSEKTNMCSYDPKLPVSMDYLYCFRDAFPFLALTTDNPPFYTGTRMVNGHRQRHTIRGIDWDGGKEAVPIVIVTHDRLTVLLETIRSFHRYIRTPFRIAIHDEGSTYGPLLAFLSMLELNGVDVVRVPPSGAVELTSPYPLGYVVRRIARTVNQLLQSTHSSYYVVTDPDCAMDSAPPFILEVYKRALDLMPHVRGVGAEIRTDDVSLSVVKTYGSVWLREKAKVAYEHFIFENKMVRFVKGPVDTTFCMYRRNFRFDRMAGSVKLVAPFGVRHLDYYFESMSSPPDVREYLSKDHLGISHGKEYLHSA